MEYTQEKMEFLMIKLLKKSLGTPDVTIGKDTHFMDFHVDSLTAMVFFSELEAELGSSHQFEISPELFFKYQTISELAGYLVIQLSDERTKA